jgi:hypothetical protein
MLKSFRFLVLLHTNGILNFSEALLFLGSTIPKQLDSTAFHGLFRIKGLQLALRACVYDDYDKLHLEYDNMVENIV